MRAILVAAATALALPVLALAAGQMSPVVSAKLKGSSETPVKGDPDGKGFVVVTFHGAKGTGHNAKYPGGALRGQPVAGWKARSAAS